MGSAEHCGDADSCQDATLMYSAPAGGEDVPRPTTIKFQRLVSTQMRCVGRGAPEERGGLVQPGAVLLNSESVNAAVRNQQFENLLHCSSRHGLHCCGFGIGIDFGTRLFGLAVSTTGMDWPSQACKEVGVELGARPLQRWQSVGKLLQTRLAFAFGAPRAGVNSPASL